MAFLLSTRPPWLIGVPVNEVEDLEAVEIVLVKFQDVATEVCERIA